MALDLCCSAPRWLQSSIFSLSQHLRLAALPLHIHHLLFSFTFYQAVHSVVSPFLSSRLFPKTYASLDKRTRLNWDIHVVALVQAIIISILSLYVEFWDQNRREMVSPVDRLYGYACGSGTVGAMAAGYFLWDTLVCLSIRFHIDAWNAWTGKLDYLPTRAALKASATTSLDLAWPNAEYGGVPTWLYLTFFMSNITLNSLNWYWFRKMIEAVSKRFGPQKRPSHAMKPVLSDEVVVEAAEKLLVQSEAGGAAMIGEDEDVVRRRTRRA
ncbi:hypothetical protein KEM54_003322 [Ascosphaera aggregata]|nr:hypothetical protein KEM54_003322 [Ascosphaera aggregata]